MDSIGLPTQYMRVVPDLVIGFHFVVSSVVRVVAVIVSIRRVMPLQFLPSTRPLDLLTVPQRSSHVLPTLSLAIAFTAVERMNLVCVAVVDLLFSIHSLDVVVDEKFIVFDPQLCVITDRRLHYFSTVLFFF